MGIDFVIIRPTLPSPAPSLRPPHILLSSPARAHNEGKPPPPSPWSMLMQHHPHRSSQKKSSRPNNTPRSWAASKVSSQAPPSLSPPRSSSSVGGPTTVTSHPASKPSASSSSSSPASSSQPNTPGKRLSANNGTHRHISPPPDRNLNDCVCVCVCVCCRHDIGKAELDAVESRAQKHWDSLTFREKVNDFALRHQYGIILGGWALSMGLSFGLIARNKYQTMPQKVGVFFLYRLL